MANINTNFQLKTFRLNIKRYEKTLKEEMEKEIKEAAKDWLKTVISIVPVWSRASHATFRPLADAVGFVIPTRPLVAPEDRSLLGERLSIGELELEKNSFHFIYETDLQYLGFNEFNHAEFPNAGIFSPAGLKTPTPFNFTGRAAEQFRKRTPELPNPFDSIRFFKLTTRKL